MEYWPRPEEIEHHFLASPDQRWFFETGNDGSFFEATGVDGTGHLEDDDKRRRQITFWVTGHPTLGVVLIWTKWDGKELRSHYSKGDITQLRELVRDMHDNLLPVGLFV